jgi:hypothetical protein
VFVNRFLRRICGRKRVEIPGEWSKSHRKVLHNISLIIIFGDKIIKNEMGEACGAWG